MVTFDCVRSPANLLYDLRFGLSSLALVVVVVSFVLVSLEDYYPVIGFTLILCKIFDENFSSFIAVKIICCSGATSGVVFEASLLFKATVLSGLAVGAKDNLYIEDGSLSTVSFKILAF